MRWSCREALPWTTKTNAILTGLAGMYSTESSSHCTLLLAFPVQKQNTGHLWVSPQGRGAESSTHSTSALSSKALCRAGWELTGGASLCPIPFVPLSFVPTQAITPWAAAHAHGPHPEQGCTSMDKYPDLYELCQAPPGYRHLDLQSQVCNECPKYSNNDKAELPQRETPCLAKAAHSHDQHGSAEKLVELCYWTAAGGDYWLIAFICNSRCALEYINATWISSLLHGEVRLFQYYLKFLFIFISTEWFLIFLF